MLGMFFPHDTGNYKKIFFCIFSPQSSFVNKKLSIRLIQLMKDKHNLIPFPLQCIHFVVTWREQQDQQARCTQVSLRGRTDSSEKQSPCMDFGALDTQLFWGKQRIAGILYSRQKTDLGTTYSGATKIIYSLLLLQKHCAHPQLDTPSVSWAHRPA